MSWFVFTKRDQIDAGTGSYALANYRMPINSMFGCATPAGTLQLHPEVPQTTYSQGVPIGGIGGIQMGQMIMQPLLDPDNFAIDPSNYNTTGDGNYGV